MAPPRRSAHIAGVTDERDRTALTRTPRLIIFDCDGVLVDSETIALEALADALRAKGLDLGFAAVQAEFQGRSLPTVVETLRSRHDVTLADSDVAAMNAALFARFARELRPVDGVFALLNGLRQPICVASSSLPERLALALGTTGLAPRFGDAVFSAASVANGKPAPDLFLLAAETMGTDPSDCLVIEDSPAGIEAAIAAGMPVIAFVGASHARTAAYRARIAAGEADIVVDDMPAVARLIADAGRV